MDIEELKNNTEFADTLDGMDIELRYAEASEFRLLFDQMYFSDIFGEPDLSGKGWSGFTRDWQQLERTFCVDYYDPKPVPDLDEYLNDLYTYKNRMENYEDPDSRKVYQLVCRFLEYARENGWTVTVEQQ